MKSQQFRYILRYYIDPGYAEDERIAELLQFCTTGHIDEVMLFFNPEELNTGHVTLEELTPWLAMAKKLQPQLRAIGVDLSVNPWTTLVHSPRGRVLKKGQNFTLMVGENGHTNGVTNCPMDRAWLDCICELWGTVARELHPAAIWVEDDWRLHNHGRALGWGGCFCELHLAEFSRRIGQNVTREEVIANVFGAGAPHPWRQIWLDLWNESMLQPLHAIRAAVQKASPETRLAMMCGGTDIHSIEGRDWHKVQDAFGFQDEFLFRPTMSPYTEVWAMRQYPVPARMIVAALKRPLEICPEMESGPRHGAYSKGVAFAGWEIAQCAGFGAHAITINHFDMLGCGTGQAPELANVLAKLRPRLNAVRALALDDDNAQGANILFSCDVARYMQSTAPGKMTGLYNYSAEWGNVAEILGFSHRWTTQVTKSKQPYLVSGQTLSAFSDEEVRTLLSGAVILDGTAAAGLIDRGFGQSIGASAWKLHKHNVSGYAYEEIPESNPDIYGVANPRLTMQRACRKLYEFTLLPGAQALSNIRHFTRQKMFSGSFVYSNALGGKVAVLAAPMGDCGDDEWFYMGYFSAFRRIFLQRLLRLVAPEMAGAFAEAVPFQCTRVKCAQGDFVAAFNSTTDEVPGFTVRLTGCAATDFWLLRDDGTWEKDAFEVQRENAHTVVLHLTHPVPVHGTVMLLAQ